jgi:plasmid stabilization system protein ParE
MRAVRVLREAAQEAVKAAAWYESESPGLGVEFEAALQAAIDLLERRVNPLMPLSRLAPKHRLMHLVLRRGPYSVVVLDRDDETLVVAITHQSRRPGYWRNRPINSQVQDAAA